MARIVLYQSEAPIPQPPPAIVAAQHTLQWQTETVYVLRARHTREVQASLIAGTTFATQVAASPSNTKVDWQTLSPEKFVPPFPARIHPFLQSWNTFPPPPTAGWQGAATIVKRGRVIITTFQPFPVKGTIVSTTPQGWNGFQWEYRFGYPAIVARFPISSQIFNVIPPGIVEAFVPSGGGKRRPAYPSYLEPQQPPLAEKPNKPYRPVWDKPKEIEAPAAPKPVPLPPGALFGPAPVQPLPADKLALPDFAQYGMPDASAFDQHMREVQDMNDALAVLRSLGLIRDDNGEQ